MRPCPVLPDQTSDPSLALPSTGGCAVAEHGHRKRDKEALAEAWEGWGRSALLIVVGLAVVAVRYFGWVDDVPFATALLPTFWVIAGLGVLGSAWGRLQTRGRRGLGIAVVVAGIIAALWVPWTVLGPDAVVAQGELSGPEAFWKAPALSSPRAFYIDVTVQPRGHRSPVEVRLGHGPGAKIYKGEVTRSQMSKRRAEKVGEDRFMLSWRLPEEIEGRAVDVSVVEKAKQPLEWPARVVVRRRLPRWPPFAVIGLLLLMLGVVLDVRSTQLRPTYLATFGASAGAFGPMFATLYRPDTATRSSFFAIFLGLLIGAIIAAIVLKIARRFRGPPAPPKTAAVGPSPAESRRTEPPQSRASDE